VWLCEQLAEAASVPLEHAAIRVAERSDRVCAAVLSTSTATTCVGASVRFRAEFGTELSSTLRAGEPLDLRTLTWQVLSRAPPDQPGQPLLEDSARAGTDPIRRMLWGRRLEDVRTATDRLSAAH
jgi:hypothetical protein